MSVPYTCPRCGATFYGPLYAAGFEPLCDGCADAEELRGMLRDLLAHIDHGVLIDGDRFEAIRKAAVIT